MSQIYSTKYLNFIGNNLTVDSEGATENREWKLISALGEYGNRSFNNFVLSTREPNAEYSFLKMNFVIERHNIELIYQLVIPAAVLIIFNISTLFLPPHFNERWILLVISVFCHKVYNVQISWMLRRNDSVPKIFTFFCDSQIITTFLVIESLMMKIYSTSSEISEESDWLKKINHFFVNRPLPFKPFMKSGDAKRGFNYSQFFDKLVIIILIITYLIMFIALMPSKQENKSPKVLVFENDY